MFEVGKEVICIKDYPRDHLKKGDKRNLLSIKQGCLHHPVLLDLGTCIPAFANSGCPQCNSVFSEAIAWLCSSYFAPIDNTLSDTTADELIEQLELTPQNR